MKKVTVNVVFKVQKQPPEVFCEKRCCSTLLKKRLWHRCFPVNFAKFPRTPFLQNTSGRLLPKVTRRQIFCLTFGSCHRQVFYKKSVLAFLSNSLRRVTFSKVVVSCSFTKYELFHRQFSKILTAVCGCFHLFIEIYAGNYFS